MFLEPTAHGHYFAINESMGDGHGLKLVALVSLFTGTVFIGRGRRDPRIDSLPSSSVQDIFFIFTLYVCIPNKTSITDVSKGKLHYSS